MCNKMQKEMQETKQKEISKLPSTKNMFKSNYKSLNDIKD